MLARVSTEQTSRAQAWPGWVWALLIAGVVALVFQGARHGEFLDWDDDINIVQNTHLRGLSWENVRWMFTDAAYMRRYVPLAWLDWAVEYELFGLTAKSSHVGNIALHALNAVLVFVLVRRVLARGWRGRPGAASLVPFAAAVGAAIWAVHPLRVETVAWASGRIYAQATLFALMATLAYFKACEGGWRGTARGWWLVSIGALAASLLTYPIALAWFAILPLIDVFVFGRSLRERAVWLEKIPFVLVALGVGAATLVARLNAAGIWEPAPTLEQFGIGSRLMQAFHVWAYYAWRPFVPVDLAPVYTTLVAFKPTDASFVVSAVAVIVVTALLVWRRHAWPGVLALWLAHLVLLVPLLGVTEHPHYTNDRYGYLQGVVGALALGAGVMGLTEKLSWRWMPGPAVVAVVALAALSVKQIGLWRNSETLLRHLHGRLAGDPYRADIAMRLGDTLRLQQRFAEAKPFYEESLQIRPAGPRAGITHFGLGAVALATGKPEEAARHYVRALELKRDLAEAYAALGELLLRARQPQDAVRVLRSGVTFVRGDAALHHLLGLGLFQAGAPAEALAELETAVRLRPSFVEARTNLATALLAAGRETEAAEQCEAALRLRPGWAEAEKILARIRAGQGR